MKCFILETLTYLCCLFSLYVHVDTYLLHSLTSIYTPRPGMRMHFSVKRLRLCIISERCLSYSGHGALICFSWNGSGRETQIEAQGSGGLYALPCAVLGFTWWTSPGEKETRKKKMTHTFGTANHECWSINVHRRKHFDLSFSEIFEN